MGLVSFMSSPAGRIARVVAGLILIVLGFILSSPLGWIIAVVGIVPIVAGVANFCLLATVLGGPFKGSDVRR